MAAWYQHLANSTRTGIAKQVGGLIWKLAEADAADLLAGGGHDGIRPDAPAVSCGYARL
jgi:hypothetical protein